MREKKRADRDKTYFFLMMLCLIAILILSIVNKRDEPISTPPKKDQSPWENPVLIAFTVPYPGAKENFDWLARYGDLVVIHNGDENYQYLTYMHEVNPGVLLFSYKFSGLSEDEGGAGKNSAGGYDQFYASCPECFILDKSGNKIYDVHAFNGYKKSYLMDWGNPIWQQYACARYAEEATSHDFDGIFLDVIYIDFRNYWPEEDIANYWGDDAQKGMVLDFLSYCTHVVDGKGKILIGNGAEFTKEVNHWPDLFPVIDGAQEEGFVNTCCWGGQTLPLKKWEFQMYNMEQAGLLDKYYIATMHNCGTSMPDFFYGLSSYLLGKSNDKTYFMISNCYNDMESQKSTYLRYEKEIESVRSNLGKPITTRYMDLGVWRRDFDSSAVLVNNRNEIVTYDLKGLYYDLESGSYVSQVTMKPRTGKILFKKAAQST